MELATNLLMASKQHGNLSFFKLLFHAMKTYHKEHYSPLVNVVRKSVAVTTSFKIYWSTY